MPRGGPLIFEDFVLPALNNGTYGETLEWIDQILGIFCLKLTHKNNTLWNEERDVKLFVDWDKIKGRQSKSESYLTDSKQRFKNGLIKSQSVEKADKVTLNAFGLQETKGCLFYKYNPNARSKKPTKGTKKRAPKKELVVYEVNEPTPPTSPESQVESPILFEATDLDLQNEQVVPAAGSPSFYPDNEIPWDENELLKEMPLLNDTYLFQDTIIAEEDILMSPSSSSSEISFEEQSFNIFDFLKFPDITVSELPLPINTTFS